MKRVAVTMVVEYDPDLSGDIHWGEFAGLFAARAKVRLIRTEVEMSPETSNTSQQPAPGSGAPSQESNV